MSIKGFRKWSFALFIGLCASVLMWYGKIGDGVYSTIICSLIVGYLASNVIKDRLPANGQS